MPLLGASALLLSFDVAAPAVADHDRWHTQEHLPERLAIPGFLRGTRWVKLPEARGLPGEPRYFVLYEVDRLATLTSEAYLARLNQPSAWTRQVMPFYCGMSRGLCVVSASVGYGLGHVARLLRFRPAAGREAATRRWLTEDVLPRLPAQPGLGSVHLLEGAVAPPMTREQQIRGTDAGVDWALVITGYAPAAVEQSGPSTTTLADRGATRLHEATYRLDYLLTCEEVAACAREAATPSVSDAGPSAQEPAP